MKVGIFFGRRLSKEHDEIVLRCDAAASGQT
jgi:hypothetical protein